jgi:predicted nucleotide-binding protein
VGMGTPAQQHLGKKFFGPFFNWPDDAELRAWLQEQDPDELEQFLSWFDFGARQDRETLGRQELHKLRNPVTKAAGARGGEGTKSMIQATLPALRMKRDDARQRLQLRIDEVKAIIPDRIVSPEDLRSAEEREKKWHAYNRELLLRMFTTDEYAGDYGGSKISVHQIADRYDDPSLNTLASRLNESVRRQAARLESIIDRLELIDEVLADRADASASEDRSKVFVVHGHDEAALQAMARFLEKIGLEAIVLREQPDQGRTIIEKFEACAREVGFVVVLLTPDDLGGAVSASEQASRARQNVIFELGYFVGSLGRGRVCLLRKGDVEIPSDLFGVIYIKRPRGR